eukprot:ANDGO_08541.mRNA.1 hypothetical protein PPTG_06541
MERRLLLECRGRQIAEIEALHAYFEGSEDRMLILDKEQFDEFSTLENEYLLNTYLVSVQFRGTLISIPVMYPYEQPTVSCCPPALIQEVADEWRGSWRDSECIISICEMIRDSESAAAKLMKEAETGTETPDAKVLLCTRSADALLRVHLWFHHIISSWKRSAICKLARQLKLHGAMKPGWPGFVIVEGTSVDVSEFIRELRSMSWQKMQITLQTEIPLSGLPLFEETDVGDTDRFAQLVGRDLIKPLLR